MKKLSTLILIVFLMSGRCSGQTVKVATSTSGSAPVVYTQNGADKKIQKSIDSIAAVLRAEMKVGDAANAKALKDSMNTLVYADTNFLPVRNGKMVVNFTKPYDSSAVVQKNLNTVNTTLTGNINTLSARVTVTENSITSLNTNYSTMNLRVMSLESKVNSLENWRTATVLELISINGSIATIPKSATSTSTSVTTTTTQTILAP